MASISERITSLYAPPESLDPVDLDTLGDDTAAGSRPRKKRKLGAERGSAVPSAPEAGRLRMRPKVPVIEKYKGQKVDRSEVFGGKEEAGGQAADSGGMGGLSEQEDGDVGDDTQKAAGGFMVAGAGGGLGISGSLEQEYEKMMQQTRQEFEVMRMPSAQETRRKEDSAKQLQRQLDTWGAMVELRIHLEGALAVSHRLPSGAPCATLRAADARVVSEADAAAEAAREVLAELLELQGRLAVARGIPEDPEPAAPEGSGGRQEAHAWAAVNSRLHWVLDWELGVADEWKERTRLEARRSFKVLDQSLATQMEAVSEVDPEKLRRRCTPPPDKHSVFGSSLLVKPTEAAQEGGDGVAGGGSQTGDSGVEAAKPGAGALAEGPEQDIYDDRDFYVQLLREVLAGGGKPGESFDREDAKELRAELQGRRAAKKSTQAEVERRASKGRKIRYVPVEKLQNFMAPKPRRASNGFDGEGRQEAVDAILRALFAESRTGSL